MPSQSSSRSWAAGQTWSSHAFEYCTWTGIASDEEIVSQVSLPITDKIQFIVVEHETPRSVGGMVSFELARQVCVGILDATDFEPPLLRTLAFPNATMLQQLET